MITHFLDNLDQLLHLVQINIYDNTCERGIRGIRSHDARFHSTNSCTDILHRYTTKAVAVRSTQQSENVDVDDRIDSPSVPRMVPERSSFLYSRLSAGYSSPRGFDNGELRSGNRSISPDNLEILITGRDLKSADGPRD